MTWDVDDPESGVASSTGCDETILSDETSGTGTTVTCSATNAAGLSASESVTIKINKTAPDITLTSPADGANYLLGAGVTASYSCTDALSGIASCTGTLPDGASIDTSTPGSDRSFTVDATDVAGNAASVTHTYNIIYSFNGFLPPIANLPVVNLVTAGRTVPVKWQLLDSSANYISDLGAVTSIESGPIPCDSAPAVVVGETTDSTGGSSLRYDPAGNQFVYDWQTLKAWTGCRMLQLMLNDGTTHLAKFSFK